MMKKYLSSATNPPVYTVSANTSHTPSAPPQSAVGLYPVIHDPLPSGDANRSLRPTIQAPVFHITSGQVNLESDTMDAAKKAHRKLNERVDCLDHQLQDLQQRADRETGSEVHSSQEGGESGPLLMDLDAPITLSTPLCPQPSLLTGALNRNEKQDQLSASGAPDLPYAFHTTNCPHHNRSLPFPRPRKQDGAILPKDQDDYQETATITGKFTGEIEGSMIPKRNAGVNAEIAEAVAQAMKAERDNQPPTPPQPPPPSHDQWRQGPPPFRQKGGYGRGQHRGQTGCFICGRHDHWYQECPQGGQRGPPANYRGQGFQRGGPPRRGRGRGMPPQSHQMPYSAWEQGYEYDQ